MKKNANRDPNLLDTRSIFENAGENIPPMVLNGSVTETVQNLFDIIQPSREWDEQVSAITQVMGLINGGALENEEFRTKISRIYNGLVNAAINMKSSLSKSACLLISQMVRRIGNGFDTYGDYITPLAKQLSNGTQFMADCSKYTIFAITRYCQSRKIFSTLLDLCSKKGSSQKLVASECFCIVMCSWPKEAIGTNWPRYHTLLQTILLDASPYVRSYARKAAKAMEICSKERSVEFFRKLDGKTKKSILDEKNYAFNSIESPIKIIQPSASMIEVSPVKKKKLSGIPIKHSVLQDPTIDSMNIDDSCDMEISEMHQKNKEENCLKMVVGNEIQFINTIKHYIDSGNVSVLSKDIKSIVGDILKCCTQTSPQIIVPILAIIHDLLPCYSSFFQPQLAFLVGFLLLSSSSNNIRVSSNAHLVLQSLCGLFDASLLLSISLNQSASFHLLHFLVSLVTYKQGALLDASLCESLLMFSFKSFFPPDNQSTKPLAKMFKTVYLENSKVFSRVISTLLEPKVSDFIMFWKKHIPEIHFQRVDDYNIPSLNAVDRDLSLDELSAMIQSSSIDNWVSISSQVYPKLNSIVLGNSQNSLEALKLIQFSIFHKDTSSFNLIVECCLYHWKGSVEYSRISDSILVYLSHKCDSKDIIAAIQNAISSRNETITKNGLEFQLLLIPCLNKQNIRYTIPIIIPCLIDQTNSTNQNIRKIAINTFVELYMIAGGELEIHVKQLSKNTQSIVEMLIKRRKSQ